MNKDCHQELVDQYNRSRAIESVSKAVNGLTDPERELAERLWDRGSFLNHIIYEIRIRRTMK